MKKDYWYICFRNFRILAVLSFLVSLLVLLSSGLSSAVIILLVVMVVWIMLAYMFKKHNSKAIFIAYIVLSILTISSLAKYILYPSTFNVSSIIAYLIMIYLFQTVHKAQKQPLNVSVVK